MVIRRNFSRHQAKVIHFRKSREMADELELQGRHLTTAAVRITLMSPHRPRAPAPHCHHSPVLSRSINCLGMDYRMGGEVLISITTSTAAQEAMEGLAYEGKVAMEGPERALR
ncbi:hypothetical protein MVEN_00243100 [Mycena venus]|uniref:Uncharacterized protein n=1 Tax=Mycena venus TaxID=2733690 RepID=A0A8H7DBA4_9AGAR|nr:hypothetical protein MVEN_00243100 [Mycena venus]